MTLPSMFLGRRVAVALEVEIALKLSSAAGGEKSRGRDGVIQTPLSDSVSH